MILNPATNNNKEKRFFSSENILFFGLLSMAYFPAFVFQYVYMDDFFVLGELHKKEITSDFNRSSSLTGMFGSNFFSYISASGRFLFAILYHFGFSISGASIYGTSFLRIISFLCILFSAFLTKKFLENLGVSSLFSFSFCLSVFCLPSFQFLTFWTTMFPCCIIFPFIILNYKFTDIQISRFPQKKSFLFISIFILFSAHFLYQTLAGFYLVFLSIDIFLGYVIIGCWKSICFPKIRGCAHCPNFR